MALALVNAQLATNLSCKRGLANNSAGRKPITSVWRVPSSASATNGKRCNAVPKSGEVTSTNQWIELPDEFETNGLPGHKPHNNFPPHFVFGAASSAFQVEGATKEGGKGPSIWDTFCEKHPEKIADKSSGDPGAGSYYRYKEDVKLLADIGLKAYRFSISWPRVLPKGRGTPNEDGIQYYNKLIDELVLNGIEPFITLFHWDVPQALEDEYGGFLSRRIVEDYKNYVELCFERFGDRVKNWITMNEPLMFCSLGYSYGLWAPGHCTPDLEVEGIGPLTCPDGDSLREPYKVAHNILLAHAEAVHLYKEKYKAKFGGNVGITLVTQWYESYDNNPLNIEAQKRMLEFNLGWFLDPLKFGNYPFSMRALVGDRLPIFTPEESAKVKGSFDFIGLNYYTARYARDQPYNYTVKPQTSYDDPHVSVLVDKGSVPIGPAEPGSWVNVYPKGLKKLLLYIKGRYNNPPIYITENGVLKYDKDRLKLEEVQAGGIPATRIDDIFRIEYHTSHLHELEDALSSRADVRGYFVWSLLDSFEWNDGYTSKFGLNHVNYDNPEKAHLARSLKQSAIWLKRFLSNINKHKVYTPQQQKLVRVKEEAAVPAVIQTTDST